MRIEFTPETETTVSLAVIIGICEREIERRARSNELTLDEADAAGRERQWTAEELAKIAAAGARAPLVLNTVTPFVRPLPPGSGVKPPVLIGINEQTGEIDNDANAARQAFGNPSAPSVATTATAPATSTANPISAPASSPAPSASAPNVPSPVPGSVNAPPAPNAEVERDKSGIPWDERIHSRNKSKNNDGTWRDRRGVDAAVKTAVLAEIAGTVSPVEPPAPIVPTPPPPPAAVVPPPPPPVTLPGGAVPVPPAPALGVPDAAKPVVVPPPPVNPTANGQAQPSATAVTSAAVGASPSKITFPALVSKINQGLAGAKITQDDIQLACSELGIAGVAALADPANAHLTDAVAAKLFPQG